jgi:hypothetical protein
VTCEACGSPPVARQVLDADHDHTTGEFRGYLCMVCNKLLGRLGDNYEQLKQRIERGNLRPATKARALQLAAYLNLDLIR